MSFQVSLLNDYFAQYVRAEARANLNEWAHSLLVQHDGAGPSNVKGNLDHLSNASKGCSNSVKFNTGTFEMNLSLGDHEPEHDCFEIDPGIVRAYVLCQELVAALIGQHTKYARGPHKPRSEREAGSGSCSTQVPANRGRRPAAAVTARRLFRRRRARGLARCEHSLTDVLSC